MNNRGRQSQVYLSRNLSISVFCLQYVPKLGIYVKTGRPALLRQLSGLPRRSLGCGQDGVCCDLLLLGSVCEISYLLITYKKK